MAPTDIYTMYGGNPAYTIPPTGPGQLGGEPQPPIPGPTYNYVPYDNGIFSPNPYLPNTKLPRQARYTIPNPPPPQSACTASSTYRTCYSGSTAIRSDATASSGVRSENGATWKGAFGKTMNNGFGAGNPHHRPVREGREKGVGLPKHKGVGRTGKGPVKVPRSMQRAAGVEKFEGDFIRLRYEGEEYRLKFHDRSVDEDLEVGEIRRAAAKALDIDEARLKLWYKDKELAHDETFCADYGLTDNSRVECSLGIFRNRRRSPHVRFSSVRSGDLSTTEDDTYASDNDSEAYLDCNDDSYAGSPPPPPSYRPTSNLFTQPLYSSAPAAASYRPTSDFYTPPLYPPSNSYDLNSSASADEAHRRALEEIRDRVDQELKSLPPRQAHRGLPTRSTTTESTIRADASGLQIPRDEVALRRSLLEQRRSKLLALRHLAFNPSPDISGEETVRKLLSKVDDIQKIVSVYTSEQSQRDVVRLKRKLEELQVMYGVKKGRVTENEFRAEKRRRDRMVEEVQRMIERLVDDKGS